MAKSDRAADQRWIESNRQERLDSTQRNAFLAAQRARRDARAPIPHAMEGFGIQFRIFAGIILAVVAAGLILYFRQKG